MSKCAFLVSFLAVWLLFGCDVPSQLNDSLISNESSHDVTFRVKTTNRPDLQTEDFFTVRAGKTLAVQSATNSIVMDYYESDPPRRVEFVNTGRWTGRFVDLQSMPIVIYNMLSVPVTLHAGGYMNIDPMVVQVGDDNTGTIYTASPTFTASFSNFPATADFQIVNNVMYITIR